jgi:histone H3/H4
MMHLSDTEREEVPLLFLDKVDDLPDPGSSTDEEDSSDREPCEAGNSNAEGEAHDVVAMEPGSPQEEEEEEGSVEDMGTDIATETGEELDDVLVDRSGTKDHDSLLEQEEEEEEEEEEMVDDDATEEPEYVDDVVVVGQIETEQKLDDDETQDDRMMAEDTIPFEPENVVVIEKAVENEGGKGKGRIVSSYFHFASKTRAAVKDELSAAGKPCTASAVAKILGERWRALSDVERQSYNVIQHDENPVNEASTVLGKASKSKSKSAGAPRRGGNESVSVEEDAVMADEGEAGDRNSMDIVVALPFPNTRVKRIIKVDPGVKLVTSDAVVLINHATALFVESLASASFTIMLRHKRKSVRATDVVAAAKTTWQVVHS